MPDSTAIEWAWESAVRLRGGEFATTPEWAYCMHRLWKLRPGDELTLERVEMDAQICRQYPAASTEYYQAQVELSRQQGQHSRF